MLPVGATGRALDDTVLGRRGKAFLTLGLSRVWIRASSVKNLADIPNSRWQRLGLVHSSTKKHHVRQVSHISGDRYLQEEGDGLSRRQGILPGKALSCT